MPVLSSVHASSISIDRYSRVSVKSRDGPVSDTSYANLDEKSVEEIKARQPPVYAEISHE